MPNASNGSGAIAVQPAKPREHLRSLADEDERVEVPQAQRPQRVEAVVQDRNPHRRLLSCATTTPAPRGSGGLAARRSEPTPRLRSTCSSRSLRTRVATLP